MAASPCIANSTTIFNSNFIINNNNVSFRNATSSNFLKLPYTKLLPTHPSPTSLTISNALNTNTLHLTSSLSSKNLAGHDLKRGSASKKTRPAILVSEKLGEAGLNVLKEFGDVHCLYDLSHEDLCSKISKYDALIVRSGTKVSRDVFEAAEGQLKVVGRAGVGIDNVDLQAATEFGCLVVNAPTANTIAAAEHGIALLTSMARNVAQADASIKAVLLISVVIDRYMVIQILSDSWLQSITSEEMDSRQGRFGDPLMDVSLLRRTDDRDSFAAVDHVFEQDFFPMIVIDLYPVEFDICCRCRMTFY